MPSQTCTTCGGKGWLNLNNTAAAKCPMCEGTGAQWDPGREFTYEMGPFILNAPATATPTIPQTSVGAQFNGPTAQGLTCQITNYRFRWMFALAQRTGPFTVQLQEGGSGSMSFVPVNIQVHSENLFGNARNPMPLPTPFVFEKQVSITANVTDLYGAVGVAGVTGGSAAVTWVSGAVFNTAAFPGAPYSNIPMWNGGVINLGGVNYVISSAAGSGVTSQTTLTLATTYQGSTASVAYSVANTIRIGFKGVELGVGG
jgi:hypothetical protein